MNKQETESRRPWSRVEVGISPDGDRTIAVVIPQLMERRWYYYFLHNQRLQLLAAQLLLKGDRRIVTINVPWYLRE